LAARLERRVAEPAKPTPKPRPRGANEPEVAAEPAKPAESAEPQEPRWFAALDPEARRHARRLIARLEAAGAPDAEGMARRDVVGDVPAVAAFAIARQLDGLGPDADLDAVAALLADGRDDDLGVRWRLVDDDGRPITIDVGRRRKGRGRRS
jgi:inactivated superfamily I helicase